MTGIREEDVLFSNGDVKLAGTLMLPDSEGPHPAVVYTHGSGTMTRRVRTGLARHFANHGIAGLVYDKRGVGGSTGYFTQSILSFDDLVHDALAGVEFLRNREDIDPSQVGMEGASQGGWIVPLAAAASESVAFAVVMVASAVSPYQQMLYTYKNQLSRDAPTISLSGDRLPSKTELRLAREFMRTAHVLTQLTLAKKWTSASDLTVDSPSNQLTLAHRVLATFAHTMEHDPIPVLERVTCPVLALYGAKDELVDTKESVPLMKSAFARGGNKDVTIKIYPDADHSLTAKDAPGMVQFMTEWLMERVDVKA